MRRGSKWAFGGGLVAVVAVTVAGSPAQPAGKGPRPRPVFVTNDTDVPVPTAPQGTIAVAGEVAARQQGAWTVEVGGTADVYVTNSEPLVVRVEGGVSPRAYGEIIDVQTTSQLSNQCSTLTFAFDRKVVGATVFPFSVPNDQVFVVTGFDWRVKGGVADRTRVAQLFRYIGAGTNGPSGMSTGRSDTAGDAGGSITFPTGVVIEPGITLCLKLTDASSSEIVLGVVHGFLSPA